MCQNPVIPETGCASNTGRSCVESSAAQLSESSPSNPNDQREEEVGTVMRTDYRHQQIHDQIRDVLDSIKVDSVIADTEDEAEKQNLRTPLGNLPLLSSAINEERATTDSNSENKLHDAIIIGAGWAGITAANQLMAENKTDFLILEGRDRIGGRCNTIALNDGSTCAEVGSQWIHGAKYSPILPMAKKAGMGYVHCDLNSVAVWQESESGSTATSERIPDAEMHQMVKTLYKGADGFLNYQANQRGEGRQYYNEDEDDEKNVVTDSSDTETETDSSEDEGSPTSGSSADDLPDHTLREIANDFIKNKKLSRSDEMKVEWLLDTKIVQEYANDLEHLSLKCWDEDDPEIGGDAILIPPVEVGEPSSVTNNDVNRAKKCGFTGMINKLASVIPAQNIVCKSKVTHVEYHNNEGTESFVTVTYINNYTSTKTATSIPGQEDDKECNQNKEIITVKAKNVLVTVPLGVLRAEAIQFQPQLPAFKREAIKKIGWGLMNKVIMLWSLEDHEQLPWPKDIEWIDEISSTRGEQGNWTEFYNPSGLNKTPMLYAFITGNHARRVEKLSNDEIITEVMNKLHSMFGQDVRIPEPKQIVISRWGQDEFSYGAYSSYGVHSTPEHREELGRPIWDQSLYFAGEACHLESFAKSDGAILTGISNAKLISQKIAKVNSVEQ